MLLVGIASHSGGVEKKREIKIRGENAPLHREETGMQIAQNSIRSFDLLLIIYCVILLSCCVEWKN